MESGLVNKVLDFIGMGDIEEDQQDNNNNWVQENIRGYSNNKSSKVVDMNSALSTKVVVAKPRYFEDMKDICGYIKHRKIVIINLKELDLKLAQRCLDFACGSVYVLDGYIQQVSPGIILLAPNNVNVSSDI